MLPLQQEGGPSDEAEVATLQDSEEAWEDVSEEGSGGGGSGGESLS